MKLDKRFIPKLNIKSLQNYIQFWPILTFVVIFMGYLGFYTYCAKYSISFVTPSLELIIGIGLLNVLVVILILTPALGKRQPTLLTGFIITSLLVSLTSNPLLVTAVIIIQIMINGVKQEFTYSNTTINEITARQQNQTGKKRHRPLLGLVASLAVVVISVFLNFQFLLIFGGTSVAIGYFYRIKRNGRIPGVAILILFILTPPMTSYLLLANISTTFFGLSQELAVIKTTENKSLNGIIIFRTLEETHVRFNDSTIVISNHHILEIRKKEASSKPQTGIEFANDLQKTFKDYL